MPPKRPEKSKVAKPGKTQQPADTYAELAKLRGTLKFTIDLETLKS